MERLELSEIQGFLFDDFKDLASSKYVFLQVSDAGKAKNYLVQLAEKVGNGASAPSATTLNIGFTSTGLATLGMNPGNLQCFTREFREGMVTPHRQRLLGDFDSSDPGKWNWGGPANETVHVLLILFSSDKETGEEYYRKTKNEYESSGFREVFVAESQTLPGNRENFGFRDGISQPAIIGSNMHGLNLDEIKPGEFVMGYRNEYDVYPDSPLLTEKQGKMELLPDDASGTGLKDLGRNATYFVLRQLKQDVKGFWTFLNDQSRRADGSTDPDESVKLAAKMMGRWPGGAPLVKFPDKDPGGESDDNDFTYMKNDEHGMRCPVGAHIRRTNPRDNFEETGPRESLKLTKRHRIIRRVRGYGNCMASTPANHEPDGEVGLLFGCFNADISRQFEFIQYTWANYPKFKRLYSDPDPFIGVRENPEPGTEQKFTIPQPTANRYINNLQSFVTVKGGAYFFFPSVTGIRYLASI